jgi:phage tail-like protein
MGNVQAETEHYLPANRFRIRVDGDNYGEFESADNINASEFGVMETHGGGSNIVLAQSAGKKKWEDLVLTRGASLNTKLLEWYELVGDESGENGDVDPQYKKIVELDQLDRDGTALITWVYYEAWPFKFSEGKFDAKTNEFRIESVTIKFRYNQRGPAQS